MKHSALDTLALIQPLLNGLRDLPGVVELTPGRYEHAGAALLTCHADSGRMCADLRLDGQWKRYPIETAAQREALLDLVKTGLPRATEAAPRPACHKRAVRHGMKLEPRARPRVRKSKRNARSPQHQVH